MDSNDVKVWAMAFVALIVIVALPVSCSVSNSNQKAAAIANGMDPVEAMCAFDYNPNRDVCLLRAAKDSK